MTIIDFVFPSYVDPRDAVITNLGEVSIGGTPTTHFQFWSIDPELNEQSGGQYVYDAYVSAQGYMLKDQQSYRGSFQTSEGTVERIWTYAAFNSPAIVVSPPAADAVEMQRAALGMGDSFTPLFTR